jgi:elongation factor G
MGAAESNYKHKKQSGGRGQYGDVYFRIKPTERGEGFQFINAIVGGVILLTLYQPSKKVWWKQWRKAS